MADFKTHVTTSSVIGIGLGAGGFFAMGFPLDQCLLGAGLCGLAGMLPDMDSPNSVPVRETVSLSAALIPVLLLPRFFQLGLNGEQIVLASAGIYFGFRFGIAEIFKRYTVHRGMWHSIPSAVIAGLIVILICDCEVLQYRLFKGAAVFIGFMSHLILDEIYSIDLSGAAIRVKKSSGTALKFWGGKPWPNFSTYAKLFALLFLLMFDPMIMKSAGYEPLQVPQAARDWIRKVSPKQTDQHFNPFRHDHGHDHHGDEQTTQQHRPWSSQKHYSADEQQPQPGQFLQPLLPQPTQPALGGNTEPPIQPIERARQDQRANVFFR